MIFVCEVHVSHAGPHEQAEGPIVWFTESQLDALFARQEIAPTDYWIIKQSWIMKQYLDAPAAVPYVEAEIVTQGVEMLASDVRRFTA